MNETLELITNKNYLDLILNENAVILPFPAFQAASVAPRG